MDRVSETKQITEFEGRKRFILEVIWKKFASPINHLLDRVRTDSFELIKPGNAVGDDGNARISIDSNGDLLTQFKVSGTWTTADKLKGS